VNQKSEFKNLKSEKGLAVVEASISLMQVIISSVYDHTSGDNQNSMSKYLLRSIFEFRISHFSDLFEGILAFNRPKRKEVINHSL